MKKMTLALSALSAMALAGVIATQPTISRAQENEPLMPGSSSVTPAADRPEPAVDRLDNEVSPTATANTTATDQIGDGALPAMPLAPEDESAKDEGALGDPAPLPSDKAE